jgi:hypothetical protein
VLSHLEPDNRVDDLKIEALTDAALADDHDVMAALGRRHD